MRANEPSAILQRKESGGWQAFRINGDQVRGAVDVHTLVKALPSGVYRFVVDPGPADGA
ncbi:MAG: hypothetical protein ACR2O5_09150 [Thiogranum sp.]